MSLPYKQQAVVLPVVTATAVSVASTGVVSTSYLILNSARMTRIQAYLVTYSSTASTVLTISRQPTFGSATSGVTLGTLTIPSGAIINSAYYKDITPVNCSYGDQIVCTVTTASTSASTVIWGFEHDLDPEYQLNQPKLVASA